MKRLSKLEQIAFNIACEAPIKPTAATVQVSRLDIEALRAELTRRGWNWEHYAKLYREQKRSKGAK